MGYPSTSLTRSGMHTFAFISPSYLEISRKIITQDCGRGRGRMHSCLMFNCVCGAESALWRKEISESGAECSMWRKKDSKEWSRTHDRLKAKPTNSDHLCLMGNILRPDKLIVRACQTFIPRFLTQWLMFHYFGPTLHKTLVAMRKIPLVMPSILPSRTLR